MAMWLIAPAVSIDQQQAASAFIEQLRGDQRDRLSQWLKRHNVRRLAVESEDRLLIWLFDVESKEALADAFAPSENAFDNWMRDSIKFVYKIDAQEVVERFANDLTFDTAVSSNAWPE